MGQDRPINALLPGFAQVHVFNSTRIKPFIPVYMPIAMYLGVFAQNTPRSRVSACFHVPSTASIALHVLSKCQTRVREEFAFFEGAVQADIPAGDHRIVLGQGIDGALLRPTGMPLPYADTHKLDNSAALYPRPF